MPRRSPPKTQYVLPREALEAILDRLAEGVVTLDNQGQITSLNRAAGEILGLDGDNASRADGAMLLEKLAGRSAAPLVKAIRANQVEYRGSVRIRIAEGRERILVARIGPLPIAKGEAQGRVLLLNDVTELYALRVALAKSSAQVRHPCKSKVNRGSSEEPWDAPIWDLTGQRKAGLEAIRQSLDATDWNVAQAARKLGVSRMTLYKRIRQLGLKRPRP